MANKFDAVVKEIESVRDIIYFLENLDRNDVLANHPEISGICRDLFAKIGALDDFDPGNDPKELVGILKEGIAKQDLDEEIGDFLKKQVVAEDKEMGPRSLRSDEAAALIRDKELADARKGEKINLRERTRSQMMESLSTLKEEVYRLEQLGIKNKTVEKIIETEKEIESALQNQRSRSSKTNDESLQKLTKATLTSATTEVKAAEAREIEVIQRTGASHEEAVEIVAAERNVGKVLKGKDPEIIRGVAARIVTSTRGSSIDQAEIQTRNILQETGVTDEIMVEDVVHQVGASTAKGVERRYKQGLVEVAVARLVENHSDLSEPEVEVIREKVRAGVEAKFENPLEVPTVVTTQPEANLRSTKPNIEISRQPLAESLVTAVPKLKTTEVEKAVEIVNEGVDRLIEPEQKSKTDGKELTSIEAVKEYKDRIKAERITRETVEVVAVGMSGTDKDEMAEALAEVVERANDFENVDVETKKVLKNFGIENEDSVKAAVAIVEGGVAAKVAEDYKNALVEDTVEKIISGHDYSPTEIAEIRAEIDTQITQKLIDPSIDLEHDEVVVMADKKSGIKIAVHPAMQTQLKKTQKEISGSEAAEAAKNVQENVSELYKPTQKSKTDGKELVTREAVQQYRKNLLLKKFEAAAAINAASNGLEATFDADEKDLINEMFFPENEQGAGIPVVNKEASKAGKVIKGFLTSKKPMDQLLAKGKSIAEKAKGTKEGEAIKKVVSTIEKDPNLQNVMKMVKNWENLKSRVSNLPGKAISRIGKSFGFESVESFGAKMITRYGGTTGAEIASQIEALGMEKGLWNSLINLVKTGKVGVFEGGAEAGEMAGELAAQSGKGLMNLLKGLFKSATPAVEAGVEAGATAGEIGAVSTAAAGTAATGVGIPVALILLALEALKMAADKWKNDIKNNVKKFQDLIDGLLSSANAGSGDMKRWLQNNLGDKLGGAVNTGISAGLLLVALPAMIGGAFAAGATLIALIVPLVAGGLFGGMSLFSNQVSTLVPNKAPLGGGGMCINTGVSGPPSNAKINCDPNVPDQSSKTTVNKANFVRVAEAWRAGGGVNAELCFNDVVKRASDAGINPDWALWAWLHESGASNYTGFGTVEDFGIHGQASAPPNDFVAQITFFLTLRGMGTACPGLDYWLSLSTNYLTGGCDPNAMVGNYNGISYLAELKLTWSWITSAPLPSTILGGAGGGGGTPGGGQTIIDEDDGSRTICDNSPNGGGGAPLPTRDPNIPIPEGCPDGWPLDVKACINQGSHGRVSHRVIEAFDFAGGCLGTNIGGAPIRATHDGVVTAGGGESSAYGFFVDVTGKCNGKEFTSRYAHMPDISSIQQNTIVHKGDILGYVDNSGTWRSPNNEHLHYEFLWSALRMNDWVPAPVPDGCSNWVDCGKVIIN